MLRVCSQTDSDPAENVTRLAAAYSQTDDSMEAVVVAWRIFNNGIPILLLHGYTMFRACPRPFAAPLTLTPLLPHGQQTSPHVLAGSTPSSARLRPSPTSLVYYR